MATLGACLSLGGCRCKKTCGCDMGGQCSTHSQTPDLLAKTGSSSGRNQLWWEGQWGLMAGEYWICGHWALMMRPHSLDWASSSPYLSVSFPGLCVALSLSSTEQ